MCFLQADLKRQLAFLVVSHGGIFLTGIALLTPLGLAASTYYLVTDAGVKGALFLALGLTVQRLGSSDELDLHGRGRQLKVAPIGAVLALAALGAATCPGLGTWRPAAMLAAAATEADVSWLPPVLAVATAIASAALLRAYARVYLGWGTTTTSALSRQRDQELGGESAEASWPHPWLLLTSTMLLVASIVTGALPGAVSHALSAARSFVDLHGYIGEVLHQVTPRAAAAHPPSISILGWAYGCATTAGALALATLALWPKVLPRATRRLLDRGMPVVSMLHRAHSGAVGHYALWLSGGATVLCVAMVAATH